MKCTKLYCSTTTFETCVASVVNESSGSYTKTSQALPVLFMSSAIHDQVGVEGALVEFAREVISVAIASQRRTNRRPLTIGPTARSRSAPGLESPLSQRQSVHSRSSQ